MPVMQKEEPIGKVNRLQKGSTTPICEGGIKRIAYYADG